ncbi:MAG: RNA polymerase sigma factor [Pirellulaceae bacterium]
MAFESPDTRASLILRLPDAADVAAWDEFVALYGPLLTRLARRHGLQAADAEDLVQDVLAATARSVSQWLDRPDRGKFRAWLLRMARNLAVNYLTRRAYRPLGAGGDDHQRLLAEVPAPADELATELDLEYRRQVFQWAAEQARAVVAELTWQAFWLTHVESRSVADVAEQLGVSPGTVYISRSRVMSRLRELVQRWEGEP